MAADEPKANCACVSLSSDQRDTLLRAQLVSAAAFMEGAIGDFRMVADIAPHDASHRDSIDTFVRNIRRDLDALDALL